jgi:hypothetical protein
MTTIKDTIVSVLTEDHPQTVRQVFYVLTVRGVIRKVEIEYHRTVVRVLVDMREKKFGSATSVELDAIPVRQLRALARECIERHVDQEKLALLRVAEQSERELLTKWASTYGGGRP